MSGLPWAGYGITNQAAALDSEDGEKRYDTMLLTMTPQP
jgi:hypothetical protein